MPAQLNLRPAWMDDSCLSGQKALQAGSTGIGNRFRETKEERNLVTSQ